MRTVRPYTFETNSSSAHCFVSADSESFERFVNGGLFADGFGYKYRYDAALIDSDMVYQRYLDYFADYDIERNPRLNKETVLWFFQHPKETERFYDGPVDGEYVVDEMPNPIKEECRSNFFGVYNLLDWMEACGAPISYETLVKNTNNFEYGFDGYDSEPPTEKDGTTSCYAVWYY